MELAEKTEEILETLWVRSEEKDEETLHLAELRGMRKAVEQLLKAGYISMHLSCAVCRNSWPWVFFPERP